MNFIWGFMLIFGIVTALFTGDINKVNMAVIDSAKEAVTIAITMAGIVSVWTGIMKIGERSGIIGFLERKMNPLLRFLFPSVPKNHPANTYIATNLIANFLGLGWAATPAGLEAMRQLNKLNKHKKDTATDDMCMFMIINISSVQLITVSIIAYRAQFLSLNPSEIVLPGIIATFVSTLAAVIFAKAAKRWWR